MRKFLLILVPFFLALLVFSLAIFYLASNNQKGALQVTSDPKAKVYLDNKPVGQTPLCKCQLKDMILTGQHSLRIVPVSGNFDAFEQTITIYSKALTVVDKKFDKTGFDSATVISLTQIDDSKDAQIGVISVPKGSNLFLDNNLAGQTPIVLKKITDSDHELKISKTGYKDKIIRVRTVLGYKLNALIFLGLNPETATSSAVNISTPSAQKSIEKVLILSTPTGFLRVRKTPSISAEEITQVKPGETYNLIGEQNGWYEIQVKNLQGWISAQYAKKT